MTETQLSSDPASYRDVAGRVYIAPGGRVFRTVTPAGKADFEYVEAHAASALMAEGWLLPYRVLPPGEAPHFPGASYVLEHERVGFVSYPYEWGFDTLKAAALHHLDLHLRALELGVTLSDASAYNVQFIGTRSVFIDRLSLIRYEEGMHWAGHRQFCEQFLAPLLLWSEVAMTHHALYRGDIEGVPLALIHRLMPRLSALSLRYAMHVGLPAWGGRVKAERVGAMAAHRPLPKPGLVMMLRQLRKWINGLTPAKRLAGTQWEDYRAHAPYAPDETQRKEEAVAAFVREVQPGMLWDMGCNDGNFSRIALVHGARYVVGFDNDAGALHRAWQVAAQEKLALLPLAVSVINPSPDQGWRGCERKSLDARGPADALLALALLHHMAISNNIPLESAVEWLVGLAPCGMIEWVEKADPMVQRLLATRRDIFEGYSREAFEAALDARAEIVREIPVSPTRVLYWYRR